MKRKKLMDSSIQYRVSVAHPARMKYTLLVLSGNEQIKQKKTQLLRTFKAYFYYERGMGHFLFVLLLFYFYPRLNAKGSKKSIKEINNTPFYARSNNES